MRFTVISHAFPLVKKFIKGEVEPYPNAKKVSSKTYDVTCLADKYVLLDQHAQKGHALLKGNTIRELKTESRSGLTDREALTDNIILDFDNVEIHELTIVPPYSRKNIELVAERLISKLPSEFRTADYIVHTSASMGRQFGRFSLHIEFALKKPVHPKGLKTYLRWLNQHVPELKAQMSLTASGSALKYPLDISLADNSRIIYLGTPYFEGEPNPIPNNEDRLFFVHRLERSIDIEPAVRSLDAHVVANEEKKLVKELRRLRGLPEIRHKVQNVRIDGHMVPVVTNPDNCTMQFWREGEEFVYYNINGGDSNAYYVRKYAPQIVHNFKGEPKFLFERADPETYAWHLEQYPTTTASGEGNLPLQPLIFRDFASDTHYNGLFDPNIGQMHTLAACRKDNLGAFMNQHGGVMPEVADIPTWEFVFAPHDPRMVDVRGRFMNKYVESAIVRNPISPPDDLRQGCPSALGNLLEYCPTIVKILDSICAGDEVVLAHFINWIAYILQNKIKTETAWIFQGVEGTGKGVLANQILRPIFAKDTLCEIRVENIEETFNAWRERSLLVCVDEFKLKDSTTGHRLFNKIKNIITEPKGMIRAMRENPREVDLYDNYIFFSNEHDIMEISDTDRRFNVAPRQEIPIIRRHPGIRQEIHHLLPSEVPFFAAYLLDFQVDDYRARNALDNEAKSALADAGRTSVDEFCRAIKTGDLDYFIQVFDFEPRLSGNDWVVPAQNAVRTFLNDYDPAKTTYISLSQLMAIYNVLVGECSTPGKLGKNMAKHGLRAHKTRIDKRQIRAYGARFTLYDNNIEELRDKYTPSYLKDLPDARKDLIAH